MRNKIVPKKAIAIAFFAITSPTSHAEWVEWLADASFSGFYDSNLNRTLFSSEQKDDVLGKAALAAGRAYQLDDYSRAYVTAEWRGETHEHFQRLDQYTLGGSVALTHKFGLGLDPPLLRLDYNGAEIFSDSQFRSGNQHNAGLTLTSWCNKFLLGFVSYRFDQRNADTPVNNESVSNKVFDQQGHTLNLGSQLSLGESWQLHLSYGHRWGDVNLNSANWRYHRQVHKQVSAEIDDDAFPGWTYRAYGNSHLLNTGLTYALLDGHAAVGASYFYNHTEALGAIYASHQIQLTINYSY